MLILYSYRHVGEYKSIGQSCQIRHFARWPTGARSEQACACRRRTTVLLAGSIVLSRVVLAECRQPSSELARDGVPGHRIFPALDSNARATPGSRQREAIAM